MPNGKEPVASILTLCPRKAKTRFTLRNVFWWLHQREEKHEKIRRRKIFMTNVTAFGNSKIQREVPAWCWG